MIVIKTLLVLPAVHPARVHLHQVLVLRVHLARQAQVAVLVARRVVVVLLRAQAAVLVARRQAHPAHHQVPRRVAHLARAVVVHPVQAVLLAVRRRVARAVALVRVVLHLRAVVAQAVARQVQAHLARVAHLARAAVLVLLVVLV